MSVPEVLALAGAPVVVLLHVIWAVDRRREPVWNLARYFAVGGLTVAAGYWLERGALSLFDDPTEAPETASLLGLLVACVFGIALIEEGVKRFGLVHLGRTDPHIDEAFDWVVYGVTVALGFALVENVLYVANCGAEVVLSRAVFAIPAHALNGTLMGFHLARASLASGASAAEIAERRHRRRMALIEPVIWHGLYDFLVFASESRAELEPTLSATFGLAFGVVVLAQWTRCAFSVRTLLIEDSPLPPLLFPLAARNYLRRRVGSRDPTRSRNEPHPKSRAVRSFRKPPD